MKPAVTLGIFAILAIFVAAASSPDLGLPCQGGKDKEQKEDPFPKLELKLKTKKPAGDGPPKRQRVDIPLDGVYTTVQQKGFKSVNDDKELMDVYKQLTHYFKGSGSSDLFLVFGNNIMEAMLSTKEVYEIGFLVHQVVGTICVKSRQIWLVAYLGVGPSNEKWRIKSVEMLGGREIRVTYLRGPATKDDFVPYFFWIPLRERHPGIYTLKLIDGDEKQVKLTRQVVHGN